MERVEFDRSLYSDDAVREAADAYAGHAEIKLTPSTNAVEAEIRVADPSDAQRIVDAFCNHVLFATITRKRHVSDSGDDA